MIRIQEDDTAPGRHRRVAFALIGVVLAATLLGGTVVWFRFLRDPWAPIVARFKAHSSSYERVARDAIATGHQGVTQLAPADAWMSASGAIEVDREDDGVLLVILPQDLGFLGSEADLVYASGAASSDGKDLDAIYSAGSESLAPHWYVAGGD